MDPRLDPRHTPPTSCSVRQSDAGTEKPFDPPMSNEELPCVHAVPGRRTWESWALLGCAVLAIILPLRAWQSAGAKSEAVRLSPRFLVNVNTASQAELRALPEIGEKMAQRIVDYRDREGPFQRVEDLTKIRGFGPATLNKLQTMLTVHSAQHLGGLGAQQ